MPKKKTNYEKKGFVRQLAGSIFSNEKGTGKFRGKNETKWRPRKNLFERLDAKDGFEISNTYSFSVESDTGEYKREIMSGQKKKALQKVKKRDFSGINIKPSTRDRSNNRTMKRQMKQNTDPNGFPVDSVESFDDTLSRQTSSSRQTTSHFTVTSDPTNFFSKKHPALTRRNLDMMSSMAAGSAEISKSFCEDGIENENPRSKFYQFSIDEDKESTVILPVGYPEEENDEDSQQLDGDEDTERSSTFEAQKNNRVRFDHPSCSYGANKETALLATSRQFFSDESEHKEEVRDSQYGQLTTFRGKVASNNLYSLRAPSTQSLCYSPSPKLGRPGNAEYQRDDDDDQWRSQAVFSTPPSTKRLERVYGQKQSQTQPRPSRDHRFPLSPLNGIRAPNSTSKIYSVRKHYDNAGSWPQIQNGQLRRNIARKNGNFIEQGNSEDSGLREDSSQVYKNRDDFWENNHDAHPKFQSSFDSNSLHSQKSKENNVLHPGAMTNNVNANGITFEPRIVDERPIGIRSFQEASEGNPLGFPRALLYSHEPSMSAANIDDECSVSKVSSIESSGKPMGLPSNAIMASMLFQRHHNIDNRVVEDKIKANEQEISKLEVKRGDIPRAIQAHDTLSCISSFSALSEDTGIEPWKKPTRDLLDHFANSRRTEFDIRKYRQIQRGQAIKLFEA